MTIAKRLISITTTAIERQQQIEATCLRLLARREHSHRELLDKLALRGFAKREVESVIQQLAEQNWQNDLRFAESYVNQRIAKGCGPVRIAYELQQRGIRGLDLDAYARDQGGWHQLALDVYLRKFDEINSLSRKEWLKRSRFLQHRGFPADIIQQVFVAMGIKCRGLD